MHLVWQGRTSWFNPVTRAAGEEDDEEDVEERNEPDEPEPELGPPLLTPIAEDKGKKRHYTKISSFFQTKTFILCLCVSSITVQCTCVRRSRFSLSLEMIWTILTHISETFVVISKPNSLTNVEMGKPFLKKLCLLSIEFRSYSSFIIHYITNHMVSFCITKRTEGRYFIHQVTSWPFCVVARCERGNTTVDSTSFVSTGARIRPRLPAVHPVAWRCCCCCWQRQVCHKRTQTLRDNSSNWLCPTWWLFSLFPVLAFSPH